MSEPLARSPGIVSASTQTDRRRLLIYTHDSYGIGHVGRVLTIAGEIAKRREDAAMVLVTGALHVESFHRPGNLDYVKLPSFAHRELYRGIPEVSVTARAPGLFSLRKALLRETATGFAPHLVLVELLPAGFERELMPTLAHLRMAVPRPRMVLGLRDILHDPKHVRTTWQRDGIYDLLETMYDQILVYGSADVFDAVREYAFPPAVAAKTVFCGYVSRVTPIRPVAQVRAQAGARDVPLVVVTIGGGAHGGPVLGAYLRSLAEGLLPDVASFLTLGPLLPVAERRAIAEQAAGLPRTVVASFAEDLPSYLAAADVVVTMGGYNTLVETLRLGKPAVVIPRHAPDPEQQIRAERFAALGLVRLIQPGGLTPGRLGEAVRVALAGRPPAVTLDFGGLRRAAEILTGLLG